MNEDTPEFPIEPEKHTYHQTGKTALTGVRCCHCCDKYYQLE